MIALENFIAAPVVPAVLPDGPTRRGVNSFGQRQAGDDTGQFCRAMSRFARLTPAEEHSIAKRISRLKRAYQRRLLRNPDAVKHILGLVRAWQAGQMRIDSLCQTALKDRQLRQVLEPTLRTHVVTIEALLSRQESADPPVVRKLQHRLIRLAEEMKIRQRHFESAPQNDATAARLLRMYRQLCRKMSSANLRLVLSVTRQICPGHPRFGDMLQEGTRGLMTAVVKFDYRRELRFSTYATPWIRQAVLSTLKNIDRNIRLPEHHHSPSRQLFRQTAASGSNRQSINSPHENRGVNGAEQLPWPILAAVKDTVSLDHPIHGIDESSPRRLLKDHRSRSPAKLAQRNERRVIVDQSLEKLDSKERAIVQLMFGLEDGVQRNMAEVGREVNLSRERVRQIQKQALAKLETELKRQVADPADL